MKNKKNNQLSNTKPLAVAAPGPKFTTWKTYEAKNKKGEWVISEFLSGLDKSARISLSQTIKVLSQLEMTRWNKPQPASATKNNIYVIRFQDRNRTQYRIFGKHFTENGFIFLMATHGTERDNVYIPKVSVSITHALRLSNECKHDWVNRTRPYTT